MYRYAKLLLASLRELDPWRRLLAALISVNAWNLYYEVELAWVLFQLEPRSILEIAKMEALAYLLRGRVRNLAMALMGIYSAAAISQELEEIICRAAEDPVSAREMLVRNVYGLGRKGASMFLRDSGIERVYPLDRHVLRWVYGEGLTEGEMCKVWGSSSRYREAELEFEAKARREYPGVDPALVNILVFVNGSGRTSLKAIVEYINCLRFFTYSTGERASGYKR